MRKEGHYICVFQTDCPWFSCATLQGWQWSCPMLSQWNKRPQCYKGLVLLGHGGSLGSLESMPLAQLPESYKYIASSRLFGEGSVTFLNTFFITVDGMFVMSKAPQMSVIIGVFKELVPQLFTYYSAKCYKQTTGLKLNSFISSRPKLTLLKEGV